MSLESKETNFKRLLADWDQSATECARLYMLWQAECERRLRLQKLKNDAWAELEIARTEARVGRRDAL